MRMTLYDYCAERDELVLLTQWAPVKNRTLTPREGSYGRRQKNWRTYWPERWPPSGASPDLTPEHVTAGSRRMAWRECPNGHIWKATIYSRAGPGSRKCGCPVCAGRIQPERTERYRLAMAEHEKFPRAHAPKQNREKLEV